MTDLFYTDLEAHAEAVLSQYTGVSFDGQILERLSNIAAYYRDRTVLADGFSDLSAR